MTHTKYRSYSPVGLTRRTWPDRVISSAPRWCSVDLRDGNQALVEPMGLQRKRRMYDALLGLGFKEIEVGFPAASGPDRDFIRMLIDEDLIPDDVTIQVLTQARDELIDATFEALAGVKRAVVHMYNSTSEAQRRIVFGMDRAGIIVLAQRGVARIRAHADRSPADIGFQYTPESFTGTELDFAVEISEAVMDVWQPTADAPMVINLPATVEMSTPNIYADQIEWFSTHIKQRERVVLSVHPHNDRGTGVAAAELAVMAGAERVEGTLFGNGERTGNVDIVTLALNLHTQGVDPQLDFSAIEQVVEVAEYCNRIPVHPRHPYAGALVYTAFSGSHQDAIRKGLAAWRTSDGGPWDVPYLPIDPADLGCSYEAVIRINSQSGKGGLAYVLETDHELSPPRELMVEFARVAQRQAEQCDGELTSIAVWQAFESEYLTPSGRLTLVEHETIGAPDDHAVRQGRFTVSCAGQPRVLIGSGNGPVDAFVDAIRRDLGVELTLDAFHQHAIGGGADARAVTYCRIDVAGHRAFGVGIDADIVGASLRAVVSGLDRLVRHGEVDLSSPHRGGAQGAVETMSR